MGVFQEFDICFSISASECGGGEGGGEGGEEGGEGGGEGGGREREGGGGDAQKSTKLLQIQIKLLNHI